MRLLILAAGAALSLAACKNNDQHDTTANVDENLTAENIVSNDVTAIDAVTGEAANMAADVNYAEADDTLGDETANSALPMPRPKPSPSAPHRSPVERKSPSEPTTNSATNTAE
jgi:hypothetical protein